ncbi:MAG: glycosyltransferase [Clostridia bacterium]|nr:glycosyltransferase [Clostridia bacterium]NCD01814.1 glycosyltransferase [Clostridia bacterium]
MALLSVVLPSYNEELMIERAAERLGRLLNAENITFELIFIDDGSKDGTWFKIEEEARRHKYIRGIHFSRNFGKESAIFAGLAEAGGDCCVVMDCDLQHPPETVVEMYRLWEKGYEVVEGVKHSRGQESLGHKMSAGLFYRIMSKATGIDMSRASDFKLLDKKAVTALLDMPERNAFFRALSSWIGFKTATVKFDVREREAGESKWSTWSLIKYAVTNIAAFSSVPLQIVTVAGVFMFVFALVMGVESLVRYFGGRSLEGFTTVILLILIIGSMVMMSLGIIGYYISQIYKEVKGRPRYIISRTVGYRK